MKMLLIATLTVLATACSTPSDGRYPGTYALALNEFEGSTVPDDAVPRFVAFFTQLQEPGLDERVTDLYAPTLHFSDTLTIVTTRDELLEHFARIQASGTRIDVIVDDVARSGADLYLRWRMTFHMKVGGEVRDSHTIGMTLLRFDDEGRVRFHQDFWDSAEGFYRHVPVLGWVMEQIRLRTVGH